MQRTRLISFLADCVAMTGMSSGKTLRVGQARDFGFSRMNKFSNSLVPRSRLPRIALPKISLTRKMALPTKKRGHEEKGVRTLTAG